ncbi:cyanophycin synthetase [Sphingomonas sp. NIBR02145]|uniref:cyanophycin synthetase n=1 Tax=Sphingomonas sp. NIBR02145 TaxID=3014784 RepID=UPI0022B588A8|nr:cyanophycin synthetase [Sphingomonas sp. NIBR02145]WHU04362.1 cyanophycin synthetase [Sphingomonas sp. NIBR02145]
MRVLERSVYRGPHLYSVRPMVRIQIDLGELESWPSDRLPCFAEQLTELLPGLANHGCSYREPGGFLRRLHDGTWLGHIIEHVALELQTLAGSAVTRGKTRSVKDRPGVYNILYEYRDEATALAAGAFAIRLIAALLPEGLDTIAGLRMLDAPAIEDVRDVPAMIAALEALLRKTALGPTTRALVEAARARGIPVLRLDDFSLVQLGYGSRQRRLRASITGATAHIAVEIAADKSLTKRLLSEAGLPVPRGTVVRTADAAAEEAARFGYPIVVKPLDGNHGRGVSSDLHSEDAVRSAFDRAAAHSRRVIVEQQVAGNDHRILVVGGKVVAVAERVPARVIGDGLHRIEQLIADVNADPRRGVGHENVLTRIVPDAAMEALLAKSGRTLKSVPMAGEEVVLRETANLSTGGTAVDRTDAIHPDTVAIAEQVAAVVGLDVCGIDFLTSDIARPIAETGGGIVEVNAAPGFRMHLEPSSGTPRDVAGPVIDALFPRPSRSRIPIFAITGTNGKSTTVRMVSRILCEHGLTTGMSTTSGIYIDGRLTQEADASGPKSARAILRHPKVDAAILETARGGILREGLGFDRCDVGAVLNVTPDHLGIKGINTLEDLADVKSVVVESVARRGHSILNADDPMCERIARRARGTPVWFSMFGDTLMPARLRDHVQAGGMAVVRETGSYGGTIVLHRDGERIAVMPAAEIPATIGGIAEFNIENALAAAAMTLAHGVPVETVRRALAGFTSSFEESPGRLNIDDSNGFRVIVDYAHNPASLTALGQVIGKMRERFGRVIGMVSIPGDRRDADIAEMGRLAGAIFDEIVFREAPDGRGRQEGEVTSLMSDAALGSGLAPERIRRIVDEHRAAEACLRMAAPGDLVVLMPTAVERVWRLVLDFEPAAEAAEPKAAAHA